MKGALRLENIGNILSMDLEVEKSVSRPIYKGASDFRFKKAMLGRPWCAEITGFSEKYRYEREFLTHDTDYTDSTASRGTYLHYIVEQDKVYEAYNVLSWRKWERFFFKVNDAGEIEKIEESEVIVWLKKASE